MKCFRNYRSLNYLTKILKRLLPFSVLIWIILPYGCDTGGYHKTEGGMEYRIHEQAGGPTPELGDIIEMHMVMRYGDSIFSDSYEHGHPVYVALEEPAFRGDFMEGLALTGIGDSATFRVSVDSMYGDFRPAFMDAGSYMALDVRINNIRNEEESIRQFMDQKGLEMEKSNQGIYYEFIERGDGPEIERGDTVVTVQTGRLLDGTVFEATDRRRRPSEMIHGIGHPFEGWDIAVSMMRVGDKARFIIPYRYGYHEGGTEEVPPFSTLYLEVEVLDKR
jgi:FKBP-type peptidyl-prolyl cis-trans isomerase FkpA